MNKQTFVSGMVLPIILGLAACSDEKSSAPAEKVEEIKEQAAEATENVKETVKEVVEQVDVVTTAAVTGETTTEAPVPVETEPKATESEAAEPEEQVAAEEQAPTTAAEPKNHIVKAAVTKFNPMVLFINPGDTVTWTNMTGHDTTSLEGMIPEGAESWQSKMGEQFSHTFTVEGAYVYKCTPHASLGMISAVVVGNTNPANLDAIKASPENKGMVGRTIRKLDKAVQEKNK